MEGHPMTRQESTAVDQNTTRRRGVGLRALDPKRASPGFTLFSPLIWGDGKVYLIDLDGKVVHPWSMPYPPGLSGYLTEHGTLFYNGRTSEESFLNRFPFKGGVVLEAQRLPNGNTVVCESSLGRFLEVTVDGKIVWEYVNPFFGRPFFAGPPNTEGNLVFRALRYSAEEIARAKATAGARIAGS
jgi:hypothetical protein